MIESLRDIFATSLLLYSKRFLAYFLKLTGIILIALIITNCSGGQMDTTNKATFPSIKDIPSEAWQKLSQKKIYFGHQSVGFDIINGVKDVIKENPQIKLNIVDTKNLTDFNAPLLGHSEVGQNTHPKSKCDDFTQIMDSGLGERADIAFFKLCFVDINVGADPHTIFAYYRETMSVLKKKYPKTIFVHTTVPLTTVQPGIKTKIKLLLGKSVGGYEGNIEREQYNQLLRKEYEGKEPIFDLAKIESTLPNGSKATFQRDGKGYPHLVDTYTNDGGHLNEEGRRLVATQFLILLVNCM